MNCLLTARMYVTKVAGGGNEGKFQEEERKTNGRNVTRYTSHVTLGAKTRESLFFVPKIRLSKSESNQKRFNTVVLLWRKERLVRPSRKVERGETGRGSVDEDGM